MNRIFNNRTVLICGLLPTISKNEITFEQYKAARGLYIVDPWERVKSIFSKDALGNKHPELVYAIQMAEFGAFIGLFFGGVIEAVQKTESFIHRSDTNIFMNKREAYKILANHNMLSFMRGGLRTAPQFAIFFGGFFLVSSCCEAYRNKSEIVDSTMGGTVVGSISRFMFGIKGMISGGILGGILGTIYGSAVWCVNKISKTDQLELKYAQFAMSNRKLMYLDTPRSDEESLDEEYHRLLMKHRDDKSSKDKDTEKSSQDTEKS